jgi:hypothetical protein
MADPRNVTKEIQFYQNKKQWEYINYYENRMLKVWIIDMRRICFFQSYTEAKEFEKVVKKRWIWWMFFPSQPQFYYSGLA